MFCVDLRTVIISLYSINCSVFYNRGRECSLRGTDWVFKSDFYNRCSVYCAVRTGSLNQIFITDAEYLLRGTDWVFKSDRFFITEAESVYCAARTGSLNQIFITEADCLLRGTDWVFKSDFYNRECLLRGTDWVFKSDRFL